MEFGFLLVKNVPVRITTSALFLLSYAPSKDEISSDFVSVRLWTFQWQNDMPFPAPEALGTSLSPGLGLMSPASNTKDIANKAFFIRFTIDVSQISVGTPFSFDLRARPVLLPG